MNHVEREILSALIDGELTTEEQHFVHEHLQQCDACREASDEFAHIHGMIERLPPLIAPEAFVRAALQPSRRTRVRIFVARVLGSRRRRPV